MRKDKIKQAVALAEDIFQDHYAGPSPRQACHYWARAGVQACRAVGLDAVPQAGSVQWQIQHGDSDRNAFAYAWQGMQSAETQGHIDNGYLPEMHSWFALPREQIIIDMASGFQRDNCRLLTGLEWADDLILPRHIVLGHGKRNTNQHRWTYRPTHEATRFLLSIWRASPWGDPLDMGAEEYSDLITQFV